MRALGSRTAGVCADRQFYPLRGNGYVTSQRGGVSIRMPTYATNPLHMIAVGLLLYSHTPCLTITAAHICLVQSAEAALTVSVHQCAVHASRCSWHDRSRYIIESKRQQPCESHSNAWLDRNIPLFAVKGAPPSPLSTSALLHRLSAVAHSPGDR